MNGSRAARNWSAAVVAGIAAWSSYQHMVHVALTVGERPDVAYLVPLSVDGMLVVASTAMVDDKRNGRRVRWSARIAFAAGITASLAANVAAAHPTIGARLVAAWPAVALLLTVELLSRMGRLLGRGQAAGEAPSGTSPTGPDAVPAEALAPQVETQTEPPAAVPTTLPTSRAPQKTDAELLRMLRSKIQVPRDDDGYVGIGRFATTAGIGRSRSRRLLAKAELLRPSEAAEDSAEGYRTNGHNVLAEVTL